MFGKSQDSIYIYPEILDDLIDFIYAQLLNQELTMKRYTKADLEELVSCQLENLNAMHDLLRIMKTQNELLESANEKLSREISNTKTKGYRTAK